MVRCHDGVLGAAQTPATPPNWSATVIWARLFLGISSGADVTAIEDGPTTGQEDRCPLPLVFHTTITRLEHYGVPPSPAPIAAGEAICLASVALGNVERIPSLCVAPSGYRADYFPLDGSATLTRPTARSAGAPLLKTRHPLTTTRVVRGCDADSPFMGGSCRDPALTRARVSCSSVINYEVPQEVPTPTAAVSSCARCFTSSVYRGRRRAHLTLFSCRNGALLDERRSSPELAVDEIPKPVAP